MPSLGSTLSRDSLPVLSPPRPSICLPTLAFLQLTASSRCLKMLRNERKGKNNAVGISCCRRRLPSSLSCSRSLFFPMLLPR
ncbi:uncharacterized protein CCOS01_15986 [Colletotrichum costaricense]|uniref:Uncharacterized protein n=2 Tax=Colletotrichum acutatum species complex TaxID=2707335 RepID=A0AAJ0DSQ9_9PEZI|nr:uncharacterized protein CCOS01_15986 [Colletotrichum costaricense]KAK1507985.1 hypothetical protein CCOS01_15986 [Colletotrichum costaricense]